jgi:Leucine-rich repeat (LRR) protein
MQPKAAHLSQRLTAILLLCLLLLQSCYQGPIITPQVPKPENNQEAEASVTSITTESSESESLEAKDLSWTETQETATVLEDFLQNIQALPLATNASSQGFITVADKPLEALDSLPTFTTSIRSHLQSPTIQSSTPIREEYLQDSRKTAAQNRTKFGHSLPSSINNTPVLPLNTQATGKRKGISTNVAKSNKPKLTAARDQQLAYRQKRAAQNRTKIGHGLSAKKDQADVLNTPLNWRSREGHILLELYEAQGCLRAKVADKFSSQLIDDLPVTVFPGISLSDLASYSAIKLQQYVHIQINKGHVLGQVISSQGGLSGGVKKHKKGKASKEEESSEEEEEEIEVAADNPEANNEGLVKELKLQAFQGKLDQSAKVIEAKENAYKKLQAESNTKLAQQEADFKKQLQEEKLAQETAYEKLQEESKTKLAQEMQLKGQLYEMIKASAPNGEAIVKALAKNSTKFQPNGDTFTEPDMIVLINHPGFQKLTQIALGGRKISDASLQILAPQLKGLTNLKELKLDNNQIGDVGMQALGQSLKGLTNLQSLWLQDNQIGDVGMQALGQSLKGLTNLQSLWLSHNQIGDVSMQALGQSLQGLRNLQILGLSHNQIGDAGMQDLLPNLKELTNLKSLGLGNNKIGDVGLQTFGQNLKGLTNLQRLDLNDNQIDDAGMQALAPNLKELTNLRYIYLHNNQIGGAGMRDFGQNLKYLTNVQCLWLNNNQMGEGVVLQALAQNLKDLMNLEELNLGSNQISDAGIKVLVENLKGLKKLKYLHLDNNQIGDVGMQALAPSFKGLTNWRYLYLENNQIGDEGVKVLGQHLQEVRLKCISLGKNNISTETKTLLKRQCRGIIWNFES